MVICFSSEKQVLVAPKDVYRLSIFVFPHPYRLALAVSKSPAVFTSYHAPSKDFEKKIEGLWTGSHFTFKILWKEHVKIPFERISLCLSFENWTSLLNVRQTYFKYTIFELFKVVVVEFLLK